MRRCFDHLVNVGHNLHLCGAIIPWIKINRKQRLLNATAASRRYCANCNNCGSDFLLRHDKGVLRSVYLGTTTGKLAQIGETQGGEERYNRANCLHQVTLHACLGENATEFTIY